MSVDGLKKEFVTKYLTIGEEKFYRFLLVYALKKLVLIDKGDNTDPVPPDLEYLEYHNRFIILYRREGEEVYLQVARLFRKAAHRIYRIMLKKGMTAPNAKFLNLV